MKKKPEDPWALAKLHHDTGLWPRAFRRALLTGTLQDQLPCIKESKQGLPVHRLRAQGVRPLCPSSDEWPDLWSAIPDAPTLVYAKGKIIPFTPTLAIVGSRTLDPYARRITRRVVQDFASRFPEGQVVSGGAMGVDQCALEAALEEGLHTTVVLATGVEEPRPKCLHSLLLACLDNGTFVSECYPGVAASARMFPERNRLISGLGDGLVVVRAAVGSGSQHTIRHALKQGRPTFGVVGMIDDPRSEAIHDAIRENLIWPMWRPEEVHRFWPTKTTALGLQKSALPAKAK